MLARKYGSKGALIGGSLESKISVLNKTDHSAMGTEVNVAAPSKKYLGLRMAELIASTNGGSLFLQTCRFAALVR